MRNWRKILIMSLALLLLVSMSAAPAFANSAQSYWHGTDATGAMITDGDCPITVEKELLTFDLGQFPENYYREEADFLKYDAKVKAEYTFYNPADYTVEATLVFPFGGEPDYGEAFAYADKYDITVDGEPVDYTIRHTLFFPDEQFKLDEDLENLHDGYMKDDFYRPDIPVTLFTYQASGVDLETYNAASAAFMLNADEARTRVYFQNCNGGRSLEDGGVQLESWVEPEKLMEVYVIGEPLEPMIDWKFYENGACETEIEGTMTLVGTESMMLKDFAMAEYDAKYGVLESDWYNAIITLLRNCSWGGGAIPAFDVNFNMSHQLMQWYEYDIVIGPGERIVNAVTAPIYPAIDSDYEPPIYKYTYLLSPAQTWADFGTLDIEVNTPFYMTKSGPEGFEWQNPGYELHLDSLPDGELTFTLCADEKPDAPGFGGMPQRIFFLVATFITGIISSALYIRRTEKREKQ